MITISIVAFQILRSSVVELHPIDESINYKQRKKNQRFTHYYVKTLNISESMFKNL